MELSGLILSLRDQPVEPGARQEISADWTVPEGWETDVLRVEPGSVVPLDIAVTTIDEGVVTEVSGVTKMVGECVRCLDPIELELAFDASEVFVYEESGAPRRSSDKTESEGDELDQALLIDRDTVNLEPVLRDAILAEAPLRPVCDEDCLGICAQCGVLLRDVEPGHRHEFLDPRFAALEGFFGSSSEGEPISEG